MELITKFKAFDGKECDTEAECRAHEKRNAHFLLVNCREADINAALAGENPNLAEAIEVVGSRLATARRAAGNLKRQPNGGEPAPRQITHEPQEDEDEGRAGDGHGEDEAYAHDAQFEGATS